MNKNIIKTAFVFAFAVLFSFNSHANAASSINLLQGQSHYYTVMMRSDRQSIVYARLVFENESDKNNLKNFSFSVPDGVKIENVAVQQIMSKSDSQACKKYESYDEWKIRNGYDNNYFGGQYQYDSSRKCLDVDKVLTYNEDYDFNNNTSSTSNFYDYDYYNHRDDKLEYFDITPKLTGNSYQIELPNEVKPKKQGALLVSYSTNDYITGGLLGRYKYNFKTLQVSQTVNKSVVSVNFDEELYSRLTTSKRTTSPSSSSKDMITEGAALNSGYQSRTIDDIQSSIGRGGRYEKQKSQLMPDQVFEVAGIFTTNKVMLYLYQIAGWMIGLAVSIGLGFYGYRRYRRKHSSKKLSKMSDTKNTSPVSDKKQVLNDEFQVSGKISPSHIFALSFASVGVTMVTIVIIGLIWTLETDYSSLWRNLILPVLTILVIAFVSFIMPLLYVLRYGIRVSFIWSVVHVGIIISSMVIIGLILAAISGGDSPITPTDFVSVLTTKI